MEKGWKWFLFLSGVLSIVVGLFMFSNPAASLASMTLFFAVSLGVHGITEIIHYVQAKQKHMWALVNGIIIVVLSLVLLSSNFIEMLTFIPFVFSLWALSNGITKTIIAYQVRREDRTEGNQLLVWGIIGILAGIMMMGHPLMTGVVVTYMIATVFVYQGIVAIVQFFKIK